MHSKSFFLSYSYFLVDLEYILFDQYQNIYYHKIYNYLPKISTNIHIQDLNHFFYILFFRNIMHSHPRYVFFVFIKLYYLFVLVKTTIILQIHFSEKLFCMSIKEINYINQNSNVLQKYSKYYLYFILNPKFSQRGQCITILAKKKVISYINIISKIILLHLFPVLSNNVYLRIFQNFFYPYKSNTILLLDLQFNSIYHLDLFFLFRCLLCYIPVEFIFYLLLRENYRNIKNYISANLFLVDQNEKSNNR